MKYVLIFLLVLLLNGCLTYKGHYENSALAPMESKEKHFVLDMEWPGDVSVGRVVCGIFEYGKEYSCRIFGLEEQIPSYIESPLELRAFDLLNFTRVLTLLEQRSIAIDNSMNLMVEYRTSIMRFNSLVNKHNDAIKSSNEKEFNNVVLTWTTTSSIAFNILLIVIIIL